MPSAAELQVVVNADTSAAESKLGSFGSGLGAALGVGVAAAGAAIAAGVAVGVKAAGDLEQSVANISTIKPEIDTSAVFTSLNEMSTRIPQTAAQLGDSLYNVFSSMDVGADQALALVETFAQGAVGAGTSAETFGTAAMGVMNAFGLSASDAGHVADVFFNTVNKGVVTGEELAASLGPVSQSAKAAGVGLDEMGAMIAAVTKEGGPAAQNINNLNNFLQKVTTKSAQEAMNDLGIATKTATGDFRPTADVLTDLKEKLGGMTESARANALQAIFPDAQARQGAMTLLSQLDLVKSATEENRTTSGAAASAYEKMSATFNSQSALLMNGLMAILTTVGAMILPMITPLITAFAQSLPAAFTSAQSALAPFIASLMAMGPSVMAVVQIVRDAWGTLVQVFAGEWAPDASINPFVNALGMVAIVVRDQVIPAVMALLAIDYAILTTVGAFIIAQFETVVAWFVANWPLILQTIQTVTAAVEALWTAHGAAVLTAIQSAWTITSTIISTALAVILGLLTAGMQAINGDWTGAWATLGTVVGTAFTGIQTIVGAATTALIAIIATFTAGALTSISTWVTATREAIVAGVLTWAEPITTTWTTITTTIAAAIATVTTAVTTWLANVQTAISGAHELIGQVIREEWANFQNLIATAVDGIYVAIMTVWDAIPEDIRADLVLIATHLIAAGVAWVASLAESTAAMLLAITTWVTATVAAIVAWGTAFLAPITATGTASALAVTTWATATLAAITAWITTTVAAIVAWGTAFLAPITALVATAGAAATAIGTAILTPIAAAATSAIAAVAKLGADILATLRGLAGSAGSAAAAIGSAIVNGITSAVLAGAQRLASAAADIVRKALQAAKDAIIAKSPSQKFRDEVGVPMVQGIMVGMDDMAKPLMRAMDTLVPMPPVSPSPYASTAAPGSHSGGHQTMTLDIKIGGRVAEQIYVEGRDLAIRRGRGS